MAKSNEHSAPAEDVSRQSAVRCVSLWIVSHLIGAFWGLKVTGLEHLPLRGPVIIASNHVSWWDGPVVIAAAGPERYVRFLSKIELFRTPVLGWFLREVGMVPVDRAKGDVQAIRAAVQMVRRGEMLAVFPEGTRSKAGLPGRPKPGVGFLARESGAPVIAARVRGTERFFRFPRLEVRFGPPMRYEEPAAAASEARAGRKQCHDFAQAVMDRIFAL